VTDEPTSVERLREITIGEPPRHGAVIELADYDPAWPELYEREAARVRSILGDRILVLEHVGSTSVPGLPAKPLIDMLLVVADSADEAAYVDDLEAAGYMLRIREPDCQEHRLLKGPDTNINLHVYSPDAPEPERMLAFRDHLRTDTADRELYLRAKRELAAREWEYVQHYADAKSAVVEQILERALANPP
jgi:GrpB-like predicted nucleotidyltransferase (UPF0157 family)